MKKDFNYFEELIADWFKGNKTSVEIISETKNILNIEKYTKKYCFDYSYGLALDDYDETYGLYLQYFYDEEVVFATIKGLTHHLNEVKNGNISIKTFTEWSSWCIVGCENVSGEFENKSLEYFCLIFILKYEKYLESSDFINNAIEIIKDSNSLSYEEFVVQINLLIDSEYKSFYYFFKSYLDNKKTDIELNQYLIKKYNLEEFPYYKELIELKNKNSTIEEFIRIVKHKTN